VTARHARRRTCPCARRHRQAAGRQSRCLPAGWSRTCSIHSNFLTDYRPRQRPDCRGGACPFPSIELSIDHLSIMAWRNGTGRVAVPHTLPPCRLHLQAHRHFSMIIAGLLSVRAAMGNGASKGAPALHLIAWPSQHPILPCLPAVMPAYQNHLQRNADRNCALLLCRRCSGCGTIRMQA
jgi:hypothetical protein